MNKQIQYKSFIDLDSTTQMLNLDFQIWLPFIGKNYQKSSNKILVVGLSHYDLGGSESWTKTLQTVNPNIISTVENGFCCPGGNKDHRVKNTSRLHRGLERIFFNNKQWELYDPSFTEKRDKLWSQIAFTQLVEKPMIGNTNHNRVLEREEIENGAIEKLKCLIEFLKPDHVLMMSNRYLYHQKLHELPDVHSFKDPGYVNLKGKSEIRNCFFRINDHTFSFSALYHPSRYRYVAKQHELINKVMPNFLEELNE
jgi:hypothetical protein